MAKYYNRGRGNLPLTLPGGESVSVPGNSWVELTGKQETCPSVVRARRKRQLVRQPELVRKARPPAPVNVPVAPGTLMVDESKRSPASAPAAPKDVPVAPPAPTVDEAKTLASAKDEAEEPAPAAPEPKPSTAAGTSKTRSRRRRSST